MNPMQQDPRYPAFLMSYDLPDILCTYWDLRKLYKETLVRTLDAFQPTDRITRATRMGGWADLP